MRNVILSGLLALVVTGVAVGGACTNAGDDCKIYYDCSQPTGTGGTAGAGGSTAGSSGTGGTTMMDTCKPDGTCEAGHGCLDGNGQPQDTYCQSKNCVDGVCCSSACDEPCSACAKALTGKPDGQCASVTPGTDPDKECNPAACMDETHEQPAATCNMSAVCAAPDVKACDMYYKCVAGACKTACTVDTECTADAYCDAMGQCKPKVAQGFPCDSGDGKQCVTGFCADGVCCEAQCDGVCQSCNWAEPGKCIDVPDGGADDSCMPGEYCNGMQICGTMMGKTAIGTACVTNGDCAGAGNSCSDGFCNMDAGKPCNTDNQPFCKSNLCDPVNFICADCAMDMDCGAGGKCSNGTCLQQLGAPCNNGAFCSSGKCVDDVCCDTDCATDCNACRADLKQSGMDSGTCGPSKAGTTDGTCTDPKKCDGAGMCQ